MNASGEIAGRVAASRATDPNRKATTGPRVVVRARTSGRVRCATGHASPLARRQGTPCQKHRRTHVSNSRCCQVFQKSACGTTSPSERR
jgi:hypothetical protein